VSGLLRVYGLDELRADGYPAAWAEGEPSIKDLIREQAEHRCIRCGHPYRKGEHGNGEWSPCDSQCAHRGPLRMWSEFGIGPYDPDETNPTGLDCDAGSLVEDGYRAEARWRILTVHHLTGCWGKEQEAKRDCRWWNLAALCQRCHLSIQRRVNMAQVWPHEHSEWFRPYAAGYYAATYLDEQLTREETTERLNELLALEKVA
jgi:hypothetical protein